jgi:hypothetical protein
MFRKNYFLLVLHGFLALLIAGCAGTVIKKRTLGTSYIVSVKRKS